MIRYWTIHKSSHLAPIHWQGIQWIPNHEWGKVIMDGVTIFFAKAECIQNLENLFKAFIKVSLQIMPHKCQFIMIYRGKPSHISMKEKCNDIYIYNYQIWSNNVGNTVLWLILFHCFWKICGNILFLYMTYKKWKFQLKDLSQTSVEKLKKCWSVHLSLGCLFKLASLA